MIELTKVLVERLIPADVVKSAFSQFKRWRAADLGADIFYAYYTLNRIYVTAEQMLEEMEQAVSSYDAALAEGRVAQLRRHYDAVFLLVRRQTKLISRLVDDYVKLDAKMHLLDRASHLVLAKFFGGKLNLFQGLDKILAPSSECRLDGPRAALVLAHERDALEAAQRRGYVEEGCGERFEVDIDNPAEEKLFSHIETEVQRLSSKLQEAGTLAALHPEIIAIFRRYLSGNARESLASVHQALDQLYGAIKANFSVEDLLMKVGDARMRSFE